MVYISSGSHQDNFGPAVSVSFPCLMGKSFLCKHFCCSPQVKSKKAAVPEEAVPKWTKADVRAVEDRLLALGPHRTAEVREQAGPQLHSSP